MSGPSVPTRGGKVRSACDLCRHRKIRCDGVKPACETCHLAVVPCTFTTTPSESRKSTREQLADANSKIRALESLIAARDNLQRLGHSAPGQALHRTGISLSLGDSYLLDTHHIETALATFRQHIAYCGPGVPYFSLRAYFYSSVSERTGSDLNVDLFLQQLAESYTSHHHVEEIRPIPPKWPTPELIQQCINQFSRSGLYSVFPIVDVAILQKLLNGGIMDNSTEPNHAANRACLVAFTALVTELHRLEPAFANADPDAYLQTSLSLLPKLLMEPPDMRTLETVVIIMVYIFPIGHAQPAGMMLAIAARILHSLGGHRTRQLDESEDHLPHRKHLPALFWLCYGFDKEMSIRYCIAPVMNDPDCDLELPENYVMRSSDYQFLQKTLSSDELLYPSDLRLAMIKSKIYRLLYQDDGYTQDEARRLQHIRELDQELSDLKSSFPVGFQPDAFATETAPNYMFHDLSLRGVNLHLEYYFCLGKIHEASSACGVPSPNSWFPLPSSVEIWSQAARSTLLYVSRAREFLNWHTFWLHAQFILTAVLSLFCYMITYPTAPTFSRDIQILQDTVNLFADLHRKSHETRCFPPMFFTEAFIQRLVFLAQEALVKATGQRS
ncbi:hypothetical protein P170DRAFT_347702 [Aspergillus steynii IBT 23096]|uniref:Zn(2)-C6 fungal-type domain-containing protein n=1 Tax=Aspergillus steynii IBT 23096 TaxID=1392250 RepID=A0A2I2GMH7_9EURO|nr:uncharacterized protein P170DRAFT_347702 [Aspergillus steynii IBT 23096]PLB54098.1 hypothetical protein P170DRAFT_347702 [Aspergillus steynii IBT 23096]